MTNKLKLSELGEKLGYSDPRSIVNWCKKNKIAIMRSGKIKYVASAQIELYYENQFKDYVTKHCDNPEKVMDAYHDGDKVKLSEVMGGSVEKKVKDNYVTEKKRSKSAQDFVNSIKSA